MDKLTTDLLKIMLSDKPDAAVKDVIDEKKRSYVFGLGSVLAALGACSAPVDPNAKDPVARERPLTYEEINNTVSADDIVVSVCENGCSDNMNLSDGLPGSPPPTASPVTTPVDTTPVEATPVDRTPPTSTIPPGVVLPPQTYTSLGPGVVTVNASDMQNVNDVQLMSDGRAIRTWGFTSNGGAGFNGDVDRICPGPVIEATEGQLSTVSLRSQHPHTLHLHGLDVDQANDGVPSTSGYASQMIPVPPGTPGAPPTNRFLFPPAPAVRLGNPVEYQFIAPHAGTYMYHCHVDTVLHMEMGMSGTIVVRPADGNRNALWTNGPLFDREYIWQLHTFDSSWHIDPSRSASGNLRYTPDYFMINGRDGVDILADPTATIEAYTGQQIAIRLVNLGYQPAIVNLGGIPFDVMASDGRPLKNLYLEFFKELLIAPGERYDIMFSMPTTGITNASVHYLDIMGRRILGSAFSTITAL